MGEGVTKWFKEHNLLALTWKRPYSFNQLACDTSIMPVKGKGLGGLVKDTVQLGAKETAWLIWL